MRYGTWPAYHYICPPLPTAGRGWEQERGGAVRRPAWALRRDPLAMGNARTLQILILLHLFFLWVKLVATSALTESFSTTQNPLQDPAGQVLWHLPLGNWHWGDLYHLLQSGNSHLKLVAGSSYGTATFHEDERPCGKKEAQQGHFRPFSSRLFTTWLEQHGGLQ